MNRCKLFPGLLVPSIFFVFSACKKDHVNERPPVKNGIGYLLSSVAYDSSTWYFKYNDRNQLTKWMDGSFTVCDSFVYNSNDQLVSCKFRFRSNAGTDIGYLKFVYRADSIIKTTAIISQSYTWVRKFILTNDKISRSEMGGIYNGDTTFYSQNPITNLYQDANLIYVISQFVASTVQPIDTVIYNAQFYNPYLMLGNHLWTLMNGSEFSYDFIRGESRNLCSVENYAEYTVSDTTLTYSGRYGYQTTVLESAEENNLLPKIIKRTGDNGLGQTMHFTYIREK